MTDYEKIIDFWHSKNIANDAQLAETLNGHSILFAYNSGKIENSRITYNDTREIFEHDGICSYTGDLRTLFEISNAKDAYDFLLTSFNAKKPVDETIVKDFHRRITQKTYDARRWQIGERPGEYKLHDYVTGKNETGAAPEDVKEEMDELLSELTDASDDNALVAAAYFHAKFENIHPFADGNGRTGRILMNYILLIHNHPPVIIYEEDKYKYYSVLEAWDERQELNPLIDFLKEQIVKTWGKYAA